MIVKKFHFSCLLLLGTVFLLNAQTKPIISTLPNGFTLILSPVENTDAACVFSYHKTGVRDNPVELKGASYLFQYLMFLETENLDPYDRLMFVKKNGGVSIGRVNYDNSVFYQVIPDDKMNNALWLESERIKSLKIADRDINIQKNNIYRRVQRLASANIGFRAKDWVRSKVFENTIYEVPVYGRVDKIRSFSNQGIKNTYELYRNPADIIMVISGHFNTSQVIQLVEKYFSHSMLMNFPRQRNYVIANPQKKYISKNWLIKDLPKHFVCIGIRTPAKMSYDHLYFEFIRYYLLDSRLSKLKKMINQVNNLGIDITYEYSNHIESNALIIKMESPIRLEIDKAKYILEKELEALQKFPLSNSILKSVKSLMEIDFYKNMGKLDRRSYLLAEHYHLFGNLNFEKNFLKRVRKISQYDIMEISKKYLVKGNLVVLNVYKK
jgi:predicted Zn-dependent peptidase